MNKESWGRPEIRLDPNEIDNQPLILQHDCRHNGAQGMKILNFTGIDLSFYDQDTGDGIFTIPVNGQINVDLAEHACPTRLNGLTITLNEVKFNLPVPNLEENIYYLVWPEVAMMMHGTERGARDLLYPCYPVFEDTRRNRQGDGRYWDRKGSTFVSWSLNRFLATYYELICIGFCGIMSLADGDVTGQIKALSYINAADKVDAKYAAEMMRLMILFNRCPKKAQYTGAEVSYEENKFCIKVRSRRDTGRIEKETYDCSIRSFETFRRKLQDMVIDQTLLQ